MGAGFLTACSHGGISEATTGTEVELDFSTITTGIGLQMDLDALTTGTGLEIRVDSDIVTTGAAIMVKSGSSMTTEVFRVNENGDVIISNTGRLELDGVASSGTTDGSVIRMGTSAAPLTDDQAGAGFVVGYFDCGDTSGWPAGLFISTNVTGTGGSFTALQGDAVLTARKAVVTGVECFMQLSTSGSVSGACRAMQSTVDFSNEEKPSGGVYCAGTFSIKGEGSACDPSLVQRISCLELRTDGTWETNKDFEKKAAGYAIYFNGFTAASGTGSIMSSTSLAELPAGTIGIRVGVGADGDAGTAYYIPLVVSTAWN